MSVRPPHYLLFSGASRDKYPGSEELERWRFILEPVHGSESFEAADCEPGVVGERLELLAVVRGLEALNQPSQVTLVTPSRYVNTGIRYGLDKWRENGFFWERFGQRVSVRHADLWKRVDRALQYHRVDCKFWRFDEKMASADMPNHEQKSNNKSPIAPVRVGMRLFGWWNSRKRMIWRRHS